MDYLFVFNKRRKTNKTKDKKENNNHKPVKVPNNFKELNVKNTGSPSGEKLTK